MNLVQITICMIKKTPCRRQAYETYMPDFETKSMQYTHHIPHTYTLSVHTYIHAKLFKSQQPSQRNVMKPSSPRSQYACMYVSNVQTNHKHVFCSLQINGFVAVTALPCKPNHECLTIGHVARSVDHISWLRARCLACQNRL